MNRKEEKSPKSEKQRKNTRKMKTKVQNESKIFRKKKTSQTKSSSTFPNKTIEIGEKNHCKIGVNERKGFNER